MDFPDFVKDLLKGVFDANMNVTLKQIKTYQDLLNTATQAISKFVNAIDDTAAFGYLAENSVDKFNIDFGDDDDDDREADRTPLMCLLCVFSCDKFSCFTRISLWNCCLRIFNLQCKFVF